jgi:hypothetical protein
MAINKNHEFEELDGVKCAVVEKNASQSRIDFLKPLLEFNKYTVVVVPSPPPKVAAPAAPATPATSTETEKEEPTAPPPPTSFTIGVTDVMFNATNAIFGRLLRTPDGKVVTLAYWNQKEEVAKDDVPYFENKA